MVVVATVLRGAGMIPESDKGKEVREALIALITSCHEHDTKVLKQRINKMRVLLGIAISVLLAMAFLL